MLHLTSGDYICAQRLSASSEFSPATVRIIAACFIGAQRLSASSEFSHSRLAETMSSFSSCSTPFGIIGILTCPLPFALCLFLLVLNAFRHHRNSHQGSGIV